MQTILAFSVLFQLASPRIQSDRSSRTHAAALQTTPPTPRAAASYPAARHHDSRPHVRAQLIRVAHVIFLKL